ncbi:hypothetical protein [Aquisalimonas sp.]|uniref:hypothetical protein n=1 Tax=Aquisalimonas sp. TaxID=1872621 RepID=UPI0025BBBBB9|nr:hypothetical protein [Aquisalimonas sp.]
MAKRQLIVVHGMGQHTEASFRGEVLNACQQAFGLYESLKDQNVTDKFGVIAVGYGDFFESLRNMLGERSQSLGEQLQTNRRARLISTDAVARLNGIESEIANDSFFTTHWLDVLLYRFTILNEPIRLRLAERLATVIAEHGPSNVHVLGHSLGTAVVHDTLAKAYGPDDFRDEAGNARNLNPTTHRLGSVHMVANVSRALDSFQGVGASIVKPGRGGCVSRFQEHRHKLDPITWVRPFDPKDNDGWVTPTAYRRSYALNRLQAVTGANTHAIGHYLLDPQVHRPLFLHLFDFRPDADEAATAHQRFADRSLRERAAELQNAIGDFRPGSDDGVMDVLRAAQALNAQVQRFGEEF